MLVLRRDDENPLSADKVQAFNPPPPKKIQIFFLLHFAAKVDIEMDGKMLNSHGVDFLDGPLGLDLDEKDLDEEETRRDMAKILKELKQKHPDKEVCDDVRSIKIVFFVETFLLKLLLNCRPFTYFFFGM